MAICWSQSAPAHAHARAHAKQPRAHARAHALSHEVDKSRFCYYKTMAFSVLLGVNSVWHGFLWICSVELFSFGISLQAFFESSRRLLNEITRVRRRIRVHYVDFHYKIREKWQLWGRLFRFSLVL